MRNYKTLLDKQISGQGYPLFLGLLMIPRPIAHLIFAEELPSLPVYFILLFFVGLLIFFIEEFLKKILTDYSIRSISIEPVGFGSKNFYIYKNPTGLIEAIKTGWSWPAFGLNSFWLLYKEIYGVSIISFIIFSIISILPIPIYALLLSDIAICYLFGTFGNQLLIHALKEKGYKFALSVNADNAKSARAQFVEHMNNSKA